VISSVCGIGWPENLNVLRKSGNRRGDINGPLLATPIKPGRKRLVAGVRKLRSII